MTSRLALLAAAALAPLPACGSSAPDAVHVAGASDLVLVMQEIVPRFERATGKKVTFLPGSSGKLAAQIREGAPVDVFFSANVAFVDDVIAAGACDGATKRRYARGRIAMWTRAGAPVGPPAELSGLTDPAFKKIALANPEHAPYGLAAREALQQLGVWEAVEPRVVYGSNIKEAMQFVDSGNAEIGVIALSLAIRSPGTYTVVPEALHAPIDQAAVVCRHGKAQAAGRAFAEFVATPEIRALMASYGFDTEMQ
jgi:molybdate transport system substrate-binding protein